MRLLRLIACLAILLPATVVAQVTTLFVRGTTGDFIEQGATEQFDSPTWAYTVNAFGSGNQIDISAIGPSTDFFSLILASPSGPLTPGPYEAAARFPSGASPSVDFGAHGRGCNTTSGRFVVLEADFGPGNQVNRFAANFEQWCEGVFAPVYGEIRINSTIPLTKDEAGIDALPDPFALVGQNPVKAGAIVDSNTITVYGINTSVPVSVTGGSYAISGRPFTSAPSTAVNGDHIRVRLVASLVAGQTRQATLNVGGQVATFTLTTYAPGMVLSGLYYDNPDGGPLGFAASGLFLAPPNVISVSRNNVSNGLQFHVDGVEDNNFDLGLAAPGNAVVLPGQYDGATRYPFQAASEPGLDFSGNGTGCNTVAGSFVVSDATYNGDGSLATFAADFTETCGGVVPAQGEVRYNSTVPFSGLESPPTAPLLNISTRGNVGTGENTLIAGFIIEGSTNKTVAIVATGPSLAAFGVTNPIANPTLTLVRSSDQSVITTNDDWQADPDAAQLQASGFAPTDSREAAILVNLPPGAYTAVVGGGTGVGVVAVYEVDHTETPLVNISTRGHVGTGQDVLIGGFIIAGSVPRTVAIVGTGPTLAGFGVAGPLADPTLTLVRSSDQAVIATNDNWQTGANASMIQGTLFAPTDPRESAIVMTLAPGAYTAILAGAGGTTGVGVVAVYAVQ